MNRDFLFPDIRTSDPGGLAMMNFFINIFKIIRQRNGMPTESKLNWRQVPKDFFWQNEANLGMELVSKDSAGKINRVASPPGYGSYIGNKKYGSWQRDNNGNQFWQFFGQYMFMRSMFGMFSTPIYYHNYHNYRSNYYGRRPYYGSYGNSGQRRWGTTSSNSRRSNSNFFDRRKTSRSNSSTKRSSRRGGGGWGK